MLGSLSWCPGATQCALPPLLGSMSRPMVTCFRNVSKMFTPAPSRRMRSAVLDDLLSCDLTPSSGRRGLHGDHSPRRVAFLEGDVVPLRIVFSVVATIAALI